MVYITRTASKKLQDILAAGKITLLLGGRQVGKTTLLKQTLDPRRCVFLNFDIEIDKQRFLAASQLPPSELKQYFGGMDILIVDEVQRMPEATRIVKGWYDAQVNFKLILTGSSSLHIRNTMVESLTGRNIKITLTPLLFREILHSREWFPQNHGSTFLREHFSQQIRALLLQSLIYGSYPEVVTSAQKDTLLINLMNDYLFKDILQLGLIKTPDVIKKLLMLLALQIGSEVSVNELATSLNVSRVTVDKYIHLLEQSFVLFRLPAFSTNPRKEITKNQKIYFWDTGIRNALLNDFNFTEMRTDIGPLFENWVIAEIAKRNALNSFRQNLYFWRSRSDSEVDLIIKQDDLISAYEISWKKRKTLKNSAFSKRYGVTVKLITNTLTEETGIF